MFHGVFEGKIANYIGKFRDFNITKKEAILNGDTVTYGNYTDIIEYLKYDFEDEKSINYSNMKNNIAVNFECLNSFYNELIGKKENKLVTMIPVNI